MYGVAHQAQALSDVGTVQLSAVEWRIVDTTTPAGEPHALLGFIRRLGDAYEVTQLGRPRERTYSFSFERARECFVSGARPSTGQASFLEVAA